MVKEMKEEKLIDPTRGASVLTEDGSEDHSKSGGPLSVAVKMVQRDNLGERVRAVIRSEKLEREAIEAGYETFAQADDFNIPDDDSYDPQTPYEEIFEGSVQEDMAERFKHQQDALKNLKADKLKGLLAAMDPQELRQAVDDLVPPSAPAPKAPNS